MSTSQMTDLTQQSSLLRLPVEIQTQIYRHYYSLPGTFYARDYHFNSLLPQEQPSSSTHRNVSINLLLTCRAIYKIASPMLPEFNGILSIVDVKDFDDICDWDDFLSACPTIAASATVLHLRLDQAPHCGGWDLLNEMPDVEIAVFEDNFLVKNALPVRCERTVGQHVRLPAAFVKDVIKARYQTAEEWGMDTWRRDYKHHQMRYVVQIRVDQHDLCDTVFEIALNLEMVWSMDHEWLGWYVQRIDTHKFENDKEPKEWVILDLDDCEEDYPFWGPEVFVDVETIELGVISQ